MSKEVEYSWIATKKTSFYKQLNKIVGKGAERERERERGDAWKAKKLQKYVSVSIPLRGVLINLGAPCQLDQGALYYQFTLPLPRTYNWMHPM